MYFKVQKCIGENGIAGTVSDFIAMWYHLKSTLGSLLEALKGSSVRLD